MNTIIGEHVLGLPWRFQYDALPLALPVFVGAPLRLTPQVKNLQVILDAFPTPIFSYHQISLVDIF